MQDDITPKQQRFLLELMTQPSLGVVCFRHRPDRFPGNEADLDALQMTIQQKVERAGRAWISTTMHNGRRVIRFCATSYLSREQHVDRLLDEIRSAAAVA